MSDKNSADSAAGVGFSDLGLPQTILNALNKLGYEQPTQIQQQTIPALLQGNDVLGVAQTGTGKTAAFALPAIARLRSGTGSPQVLCLAPTRELAIQVAEAFQRYAAHEKGFSVLPVYGGSDYRQQIRQLKRGVDVVVGTPGRVMDHMRRGTLHLDDLNMLILDEADEMLRMGFIDDVEWILSQVSSPHQTALFSATMPPQIQKITKNYLQNPTEIKVKSKTTTAEQISQYFLNVRKTDKIEALTRVLEVEECEGIMVFVRTKIATTQVTEQLAARGFKADALNGDIDQKQREKIVERLRNGTLDVVVATDVAARGLDVSRITHVFNFDIPHDVESYVHRIGRTGRAGKSGVAILFVTGRENRMLRSIEKVTGQKIAAYEFPTAKALNARKLKRVFADIEEQFNHPLKEFESVAKKFLQAHPERSEFDLAAALLRLHSDEARFYVQQDELMQPVAPVTPHKGRGKPISTNAHMQTWRLHVGNQDGVKIGDIVGAIANEVGLDNADIGKITIRRDFTLVQLPQELDKPQLKSLLNVHIRGKKAAPSADAGKPDRFRHKPRKFRKKPKKQRSK